MRKAIYFLTTSIFLLCCISCSNDEAELSTSTQAKKTEYKEFIFQERLDNGQVRLSRDESLKTKASDIDIVPNEPLYLLGRSFKANDLPISNVNNFSGQVVDVIALTNDKEGKYAVLPNFIGKTKYESFSYSSFDRYEEKSTITKKKNSGFGLNLGLFKIGSKKTITEIFTKEFVEQNNMVFGELNIYYEGNSYKLQTTDYLMKTMGMRFLSKVFVNELYNNPIYKTIDAYGTDVLTSLTTGGRLTAYYAGQHKESASVDGKEKDMDKQINASFSLKDSTAGGSANLGIGGKYSDYTYINKKFNNTKIFVETEGGAPGSAIVSKVNSIENIEIDYKDWLASFKDTKYHKMASINDKGLVPITDFVVEENLKMRINEYLKYNKKEELSIPYINVFYLVSTWFGNGPIDGRYHYCHPAIVLSTRTGEGIILKSYEENPVIVDIQGLEKYPTDEQVLKFGERLYSHPDAVKFVKDNVTPYFKSKVIGSNLLEPMHNVRLDIDSNCDFKSAKKFKDVERNFTYILLSSINKNEKDIALAIYDDFILDTYGIREWVNKMPTVSNISYATIYNNYRIMGL